MERLESSLNRSPTAPSPNGARTDQIVAVAEWLAVQILTSTDTRINDAAKMLYRKIVDHEAAHGLAQSAK